MNGAQTTNRKGSGPWRLPLFQSILPIDRSGLTANLAAGISLAAMNIPQAMGYAKIAGMPVITGLYTLLMPVVAFAAFGSSRYLVVASDSATAAILAGGLAGLSTVGSALYVSLAGLVALCTAGLLLLARLLKLGFLADFLSRTVLIGFLTGVGFQVGIAVLNEMLKVEVLKVTKLAKPETGKGLPLFYTLTVGALARCAFPSYHWLLSVWFA